MVRGLTAVITGGSGQLGRTMAQALAQAGVQVAVVSLHTETAGARPLESRADLL